MGGFREGRVAFRPVTLFDVSRQRTKVAAEVDLPDLRATRLGRRRTQRLERASKMLLLAGVEAWEQAGWEPCDSLPLVLGTTSGGMSLGEEYYCAAVGAPQSFRGQPSRALQYQPQRQALNLADALGFSGPVTIIANACSSGANAIGHAWGLVRSGQCSRVFTGGYDALSQLVFGGFDSLRKRVARQSFSCIIFSYATSSLH